MHLKNQTHPVQTRDIAKAVGCRTPKEVNPTIYAMERKKYLTKVTDVPPSWRISDNIPKEVLSHLEAEPEPINMQQLNQMPINYQQLNQGPSPSLGPNFGGPTIPAFQETSLFGADVSFDSDYSDLMDVKSFPKPDEGLFDNMTPEDEAEQMNEKGGDGSNEMNEIVNDSDKDSKPSAFRAFFQLDLSMSDEDSKGEESLDEDEENEGSEEDNDLDSEADDLSNENNVDSNVDKIDPATETKQESYENNVNIEMTTEQNESLTVSVEADESCLSLMIARSNEDVVNEGETLVGSEVNNEQISDTLEHVLGGNIVKDLEELVGTSGNEKQLAEDANIDSSIERTSEGLLVESSSIVQENIVPDTCEIDNNEVLPNELLESLPLSEDSMDDVRENSDMDSNGETELIGYNEQTSGKVENILPSGAHLETSQEITAEIDMDSNREAELSDNDNQTFGKDRNILPTENEAHLELSQENKDAIDMETLHNNDEQENTSNDEVENTCKSEGSNGLDADHQQVLKSLNPDMPTASFVLKKKSGLSPERLDACLQDLEEQGIVCKRGGSWQLTVSGRFYLKDSAEDSTVQSAQVQKQKRQSSGPPLPPMALLQKEKGENPNQASSVKQGDEKMELCFNQRRSGVSGSNNNSSIVENLNTDLFPSSMKPVANVPAAPRPLNTQISSSRIIPDSQNLTNSAVPNRPTGPVPLMSVNLQANQRNIPRTQTSVSSVNASQVSSFGSTPSYSVTGSSSLFSQGSNSLPNQPSVSAIRPPFSHSSNISPRPFSQTQSSPFSQTQPNVTKSPFTQPTGSSLSNKSNASSSGSRQTSASSFKPPLPPADLLARNLKIVSPNTGESSTGSMLSNSATQRQVPGTQSMLRPGFSSSSDDSSDENEPASLVGFSRMAGFKPLSQIAKPTNPQPLSLTGQTGFKSQPHSLLGQTGIRSLYPHQQNLQNQSGFQSLNPQPQRMPAAPQPLSLDTESFAALNKNPISALMEWAQSRKMTATVELLGRRGSAHRPT